MRLVLLLCLVAVAFSAQVPVMPLRGYHEEIGIPLAAKIKAAEDAIHAKNETVRIVGGVVAEANTHPYLGGLLITFVNIAGTSVCGSSLVTANRLLTAAHCWFDGVNQAAAFTVVLASQYLFSGGTRIATSNVVLHPQWNPAMLANDIAVIYLPTSVMFSTTIQPIALPSGTQLSDLFVGQMAVAAGYGKTSDAQVGVTTATQISHVLLQVITVEACQAIFGAYAQASNICTNGVGGIGICNGDSGGPLVVQQNGQNILVGISSFVAGSGCQLGYPSAFARVTSFYSFIIQNLF